jgi:serine/threonine protein kinase
LIDRLEGLHESGYIHNDLKPDNILLGSDFRHTPESQQIVLIDFGVSRSYLDGEFRHRSLRQEKKFQGNYIFSSHNNFKFITLSRRDDLISLAYLLSYLFNPDVEWMDRIYNDSKNFSNASKIKKSLTANDLCTEEAKYLLPFAEEAFDLEFDERPDYCKLKFMLKSILLNKDVVPDLYFDWSTMPRKRRASIQTVQYKDSD